MGGTSQSPNGTEAAGCSVRCESHSTSLGLERKSTVYNRGIRKSRKVGTRLGLTSLPGPVADRGKTLVQKKPTMYPEWKSTFDAHIYEGRVIQIVLMRAAEDPMSEVTVGVSVLAERCKKNNGKAEFWVRGL